MATPIRVTFVADEAQLLAATKRSEAALARFATSAQEAAQVVARAAAEEAAAAGKSAAEQEAAAARAAAALVAAADRTTAAQEAAARGAIAVAKAQGKSADEQVAAARRAIGAQKSLEDQQKATADAAKAAAAKTAAAAEASTARIKAAQKGLAGIGKWSLFGGAAGIALSVRGAANLSQSMERLQTQAGASTRQVQQLQKGVLNMAGAVGTSPEQLSQGLYHVVSNLNKTLAPTQRVTDELSALKVAAEGARVGGSDLVDTTNALGGAIRSGISGTQNYAQAMGALNATVGAGDMSMQNLAEALGTGVLGPMKNYGVSLRDISSALAVFGDNNIKGADAGTKLGSAIRIMAAPSKTAGEALKAIGMTNLQLANDLRSPAGLVGALTDLKTHLHDSGATAAEQSLIIERAFGGRQSTGVQLLLGQLGTLKAAEREVGDGANKFGTAWKQQSQQASQQAADLKAQIQALADRFGFDLLPVLKTVATDLDNVVVWFEHNKTAAEVLGITIGTVLGAAVLVFAGEKVVAFVNGLRGMYNGLETLASKASSVAQSVGNSLSGVASSSEATATKVEASNTALEASNTEAGASFTALDTEAATAAAGVESEAAAMASAVTAADGEIEAANASAGASFGALASAAGAAAAAATAAVGTALVLKGDTNMPTYAKHPPGMPQISAPQVGESREAYIKASLGLPPGYKGGRITAGSYKGPGEDHKTIDSFFKWLAGAGTFGPSGFVPKSTGLDLTPAGMRAAQAHLGNFSSSEKANAAAIMQQLIKGGLSGAGAAAIAGNWVQESGLNPNEPGGLLAQWGGSRLTGEMAYAKQHGLPYNSIPAETGFTLQELQGYPSLLAALKAGTMTPAQLALGVENLYERPKGTQPGAGMLTPDTYWSANTPRREQSAQEIFAAFGGMAGASGTAIPFSTPATSPNSALQSYLNGVSSTTGKAVMRYYKHRPVGVMTEAQWQAWQLSHGVGSPSSSVGTLRYYQHRPVGVMNESQWQAWEAANSAKVAHQKAVAKATIIAGDIFAATTKADQGYAKTGLSLTERYGNAAQSGTARTIENALGIRTGSLASLSRAEMGNYRFAGLGLPSVSRFIHDQIEAGAGAGQLTGVLSSSARGTPQNQAYLSAVQNLIQTGQTKEADRLVAAHKAAMQALANTLIADQRTKDAAELTQQATATKDQTTAIQNTMQTTQQVWQTSEQKINDMAAGVLQAMQDTQQTVNDTMAGVAQLIKDQAAVNTDQSSLIVAAIQDQTQIQVDQIGEKGLYGMNLLAQQEKVTADQVKAYWDQQIATAQKQIDIDQQQADAAENAARIALDNVTATEHVAVQQAQVALDTVQVTEATKVAAAQAHADAVQASVDTTKIGPAQIAVDINATASKSVQAKMQAQLAYAQGEGDKLTAVANQQLAGVQSQAQAAIDIAQSAYDLTNNTAQQTIQGYQSALDNITNQWNQTIASAKANLSMIQGSANQANAAATGLYSITSAKASTQFAGSGMVINQYGVNLSDPTSVGEAASWAIRASGVAS